MFKVLKREVSEASGSSKGEEKVLKREVSKAKVVVCVCFGAHHVCNLLCNNVLSNSSVVVSRHAFHDCVFLTIDVTRN